MPDLVADQEALADLARQMGRVQAEFMGLVAQVRDDRDSIRSRRVEGRMGEIATNWSKHRVTLATQLTALRDMVLGACSTYAEVEGNIIAGTQG